MPNRSCDFCDNCYRSNPTAGYYNVTEKMRLDLEIDNLKDQYWDFVCGDHFEADCFDGNGRLKPDAVPSFFPYKECLNHDHTYMASTEETVGKTTGRILELCKVKINECNILSISYLFKDTPQCQDMPFTQIYLNYSVYNNKHISEPNV